MFWPVTLGLLVTTVLSAVVISQDWMEPVIAVALSGIVGAKIAVLIS